MGTQMRKRLQMALLPNLEGSRTKLLWLMVLLTTSFIVWQWPDSGGIMLVKFNRILLGAGMGVILDRALFWYARPCDSSPNMHWQFRRMGMVLGGMYVAAMAV